MRGRIDIPLHLLDDLPNGPRIEFGVYKGETLAAIADHDGLTIGVDSFEGMAPPTERDRDPDGRIHYPAGKHAAPMAEARKRAPRAALIKGFVPDVLGRLPPLRAYAFVHLDMDQYAPTRAALEWCWDRMLPGAIVAAHDWVEGATHQAAGALAEWRETHPETGTEGKTIWWRR